MSGDTFALPGLPQRLSRVGFGGHPIGGHGWGRQRDDNVALAALRAAVESGYTFFDTADIYGLGVSEMLHAKMLKSFPERRDELVVSTKGGVAWDNRGRTHKDSSARYLTTAVEESLRRLDVDTIDLYYLHWPDGCTPVTESVHALMAIRDTGKIRSIGLANVTVGDVRACADAGIAAVQVKGNLLEPVELLAFHAAAHEIGAAVVCYSALADGLLTGIFDGTEKFSADDHRHRYPLFQPGTFENSIARVSHLVDAATQLGHSPAQVAIRWLLDSDATDCALVGSSNPANVAHNAASMGWTLPAHALGALAEAVPMESSVTFDHWRRGLDLSSTAADQAG